MRTERVFSLPLPFMEGFSECVTVKITLLLSSSSLTASGAWVETRKPSRIFASTPSSRTRVGGCSSIARIGASLSTSSCSLEHRSALSAPITLAMISTDTASSFCGQRLDGFHGLRLRCAPGAWGMKPTALPQRARLIRIKETKDGIKRDDSHPSTSVRPQLGPSAGLRQRSSSAADTYRYAACSPVVDWHSRYDLQSWKGHRHRRPVHLGVPLHHARPSSIKGRRSRRTRHRQSENEQEEPADRPVGVRIDGRQTRWRPLSAFPITQPMPAPSRVRCRLCDGRDRLGCLYL